MKVYEGKIADDYRNKFVQSFLKGGVCFVAGTLVLTETGQAPIETITEGEAEIVEAAAQGAEIAIELNGQELTLMAHETENMEAAFTITGERRKTLVSGFLFLRSVRHYTI